MILFHDYDFETNEILLKWREDVFRFIRISLLFGGTASIFLNVMLHWEEMSPQVLVLEFFIFCSIIFINIYRKTNFNIRLYLTVFMLFVAAGTSFYNIGLNGIFWIWILTTTVVIAIFKNASLAFKVLIFNFLLINAVGFLIHLKILIVAPLTDFSLLQWIFNTFMFMWINATFLVIMLMARNIILDNFLKEKEIRLKREEEAMVLLKTKAELKQSDAFYKEAEKIAHLGSWKYNVVNDQGYWSEEVYKIFRRNPALGAPSLVEYLEYIHADDREEHYDKYKKVIKKTDTHRFEFRVLLKGNVFKYLEGIARKTIDEDNNIIAMFGTVMDITDRKLREIKLAESEAFYKEAEKLANLGSWKLDLVNNQVIWSEETFRIFQRDSALGAPLLNEYLQYIHPDERKLYYKRHLLALKSSAPMNFEFRILLKGNIIKYIEGSAQKRLDENGNVNEMYGILMDITDRKLKEIRSREREISYKEAQELAHLGHWEYNANTDKTYWSEELYRILNWDPTKPAPKVKEYLDRIHPEDLDNYKERVRMWMGNSKKDFFEFRYYTPNCEIRYLEVITRKGLDSNGKVEHLYGTMLDITERVLVRNQLERNLKILNKKNIELDKFSYSTSHELRAPITSALGLTNLMRLEFGKDKGVLEYVEMLERSLTRLGDFITEISNFSRNEKYDIELVEIDVINMIKQIVEELSFMDGADKIEYIVKPSKGLTLFSDKLRVQLILSNLISNAIKYHDLEKPNQEIDISVYNNSNGFQIQCKDNGRGIDIDHQKKVFDMFFTTGSKTYGTGLGLYILRESVRKLGGKVSFDSEKGVGTTFKVDIPNHKITPSDNAN